VAAVLFAVLAPGSQSGNFWIHPHMVVILYQIDDLLLFSTGILRTLMKMYCLSSEGFYVFRSLENLTTKISNWLIKVSWQ
jgi:hypothetical protein